MPTHAHKALFMLACTRLSHRLHLPFKSPCVRLLHSQSKALQYALIWLHVKNSTASFSILLKPQESRVSSSSIIRYNESETLVRQGLKWNKPNRRKSTQVLLLCNLVSDWNHQKTTTIPWERTEPHVQVCLMSRRNWERGLWCLAEAFTHRFVPKQTLTPGECGAAQEEIAHSMEEKWKRQEMF